ncbi:MAG: tetratricopeptide repeat protein [Janthinobacterium lividum]
MRVPATVLTMLLVCLGAAMSAHTQDTSSAVGADRIHDSPEWQQISLHLPDPATAASAQLETAADVLRARRYPGDAMRFYEAAISHGGDQMTLLKKMGVTCLEMQQVPLARILFQRAVRLNKKDAGAWNDLGAAEFILHNTGGSIRDYKRAVKLEKSSAVFHSNLSLAYFEVRNTDEARRELGKALALDPNLLHRGANSGYTAQVLASERYPEICFEMARIYAAQGNVEALLEWLTKASERGFDVRSAMDRDPSLQPLLADARVQLLLNNAQVLRASIKVRGSVPSLGTAER